MKKEKNKRIIQLDIIRTIAILCVVLCHSTENIYSITRSGYDALSTQSRFFMFSMFTLGRVGVPLFLFITGVLLLKKEINTDRDILSFYKKNLLTLLITYLIWIIIYNIYFVITKQYDLTSVKKVIEEILIINKVPMAHMWYMPMIITVYIGIPFIAKIIKTFSYKSISIMLVLLFIWYSLTPSIVTFLNLIDINDIPEYKYNISYFGALYGLYIILGYYIYNNELKKLTNAKLGIIAITSFVITVLFQIYSYEKGLPYGYNVWYSFPFLITMSLPIFKILTRIKIKKENPRFIKVITFTSTASLAVFFIHMIVLQMLLPYIDKLHIMMPLKVIIMFIITTLISYIIAVILSKNKIISKYILHIK